MLLRNWLDAIRQVSRNRAARRNAIRRSTRLPSSTFQTIEPLEDRTLLAGNPLVKTFALANNTGNPNDSTSADLSLRVEYDTNRDVPSLTYLNVNSVWTYSRNGWPFGSNPATFDDGAFHQYINTSSTNTFTLTVCGYGSLADPEHCDSKVISATYSDDPYFDGTGNIAFTKFENPNYVNELIGSVGGRVEVPAGNTSLISYQLSGAPAGFSINTSGEIRFTGNLDYESSLSDTAGAYKQFNVNLQADGSTVDNLVVRVNIGNVANPVINSLVPAQGATAADSTPTASWNVLNASSVNVTMTGPTGTQSATGVSGSSWTPPSPLGYGNASVTVVAANSIGETASQANTFTISNPIATPTGLSVTPLCAVEASPRTISWTPVPNATSYEVYLPNGATVSTSATSYTISGGVLSAGNHIYQIAARRTINGVPYASNPASIAVEVPGQVGTFAIATPPSTTQTPLIDWADAANANRYSVTVKQGGNVVRSASNLHDSHYPVTTPLPEGYYTVETTGFNCLASDTGRTVTKSFTINVPTPGTPVVTVNPFKSQDSTRIVSWTNPGYAAKYEALTTRPGDTYHQQTDVTAPTNSWSVSLPQPGTYQIKVRAINSNNEAGPWSAPVDAVRVAIPGFVLDLTAPSDTLPVADQTPTFTWTQAVNAEAYHVDILASNGTVIETLTPVSSTTATVTTELEDGDYTIQIHGLACLDGPPEDILHGPISQFSITIGIDPAIVIASSLRLEEDTGINQHDRITTNGTILGELSDSDHDYNDITVEVDVNLDGVPDAYGDRFDNSSPNFSFNMASIGSYAVDGFNGTVRFRAVKSNSRGTGDLVQDPWVPFDFHFFVPDAFTVYPELYYDSGQDRYDGITEDSRFRVHVSTSNSGNLDGVTLQVDADGSGTPDGLDIAVPSSGLLSPVDLRVSHGLQRNEWVSVGFRAIKPDPHSGGWQVGGWSIVPLLWIPNNDAPTLTLQTVQSNDGTGMIEVENPDIRGHVADTTDPAVEIGDSYRDKVQLIWDPVEWANLMQLGDWYANMDYQTQTVITPDTSGDFEFNLSDHISEYGHVVVHARAFEYDYHDGMNVASDWTTLSFDFVPPMPSAPTLSVQSNAKNGIAATSDTTPLISWQPAANAATYRVVISGPNGFEQDVYGITGTTYTPTPPLDPLGGYTVTVYGHSVPVQGIYTNGRPGPGDSASLELVGTVDGPSAAEISLTPLLASPPRTTPSRQPLFEWTPDPHAENYTITVTNGGLSRTIADYAGTTFTPDWILDQGLVSFSVQGFNCLDEPGPLSTATWVIDVPPPNAPVLEELHKIDASSSHVLNWSDVTYPGDFEPYGVTYDLVGSHPSLSATGLTVPQWNVPTGLTPGSYTVYVLARNPLGEASVPSNMITFDVIGMPGTPVVTVDAANPSAVDTFHPTFRWATVPHAEHYRYFLQRWNGSNYQNLKAGTTSDLSFTAALSGEGQYRLSVWGVNCLGTESQIPGQTIVTVNIPIPAAPVVTGPDKTSVNPTTITWNGTNYAHTFDLQVTLNNGQTDDYLNLPAAPSSYTLPETVPLGQHTVRVAARNEAGERSGYSAPYSVTVVGIPGVITVLAPIGAPTSIDDRTPTFTWQPDLHADEYIISLEDAGGNAVIPPTETSIPGTQTSYTVANPLGQGAYVFSIRGVSCIPEDETPTTVHTIFIDLPAPPTPVLTGPDKIRASESLTFSWDFTGFDHPVTFELGGNHPALNVAGLTETDWELTEGLPAGDYTISVRAVNEFAEPGPWSNTASIMVIGQPAPAEITAPVDGETLTLLDFPFRWNAIIHAEEYAYELYSVAIATGDETLIASGATDNTWYQSSLPGEGEYRFIVWGVNCLGDEGTHDEVTTVLNVPVPGTPVVFNPDKTDDSTPTITWSRPQFAKTYNLRIELPDGSLVTEATGLPLESYTLPTPLSIGTYVITVQAVNSVGEVGEWSSEHAIKLVGRPTAAPVIFTPGPVFWEQPLELKWIGVPHADHYEFRITNEVNQLVAQGSGKPDPLSEPLLDVWRATVFVNSPSDVYFIQVYGLNCLNTAGPMAQRQTQYFVDVPGKPSVYPPPKTSNPFVEIEWTAAVYATAYFVEITLPDGIPFVDFSESESFTAPGLEPGQYFVRVQGVNEHGETGPWSNSVSLLIVGTPDAPAIVSPIAAPDATSDSTPLIDWNTVDHAETYDYELWWLDSPGGTELIASGTVASTEYTSTTLDDGLYEIRVRGVNCLYERGAESVRQFVIGVPIVIATAGVRKNYSQSACVCDTSRIDAPNTLRISDDVQVRPDTGDVTVSPTVFARPELTINRNSGPMMLGPPGSVDASAKYLPVYVASSNPHPVIDVDLDIPADLPSIIELTLVFGGLEQQPVTITPDSSVAGTKSRIALLADASVLATGRHDYTIDVRYQWDDPDPARIVTSETVLSGKTEIFNLRDSELGNRWTIPGIDRLEFHSDGISVFQGNGMSWFYRQAGSSYLAPDGIFATLVQTGAQLWTLTTPLGDQREFDNVGRMTRHIQASGWISNFSYVDANGDGSAQEIASILDVTTGRSMLYSYTAGAIDTITDFVGRVFDYQVAADGTLQSILGPDPDGSGPLPQPTYHFSYDQSTNLLQSIVDPIGRQSILEWGADLKVRRVFGPGDVQPAWQIDSIESRALADPVPADEQVSVVTHRDGSTDSLRLDAFGNITEQMDANGRSVVQERNDHGQIERLTVTGTDGSSRTTDYVYDFAGRLTTIIQPDGSTTSWTFAPDARPNQPASMTDALGRTTTYAYSSQRFLTRESGPFGTSDYVWMNGQIQSVTGPDPDGTGPLSRSATTWNYNLQRQVTSISYSDGSVQSWTYDALGFVASETQRYNPTTENGATYQTDFINDAYGRVTRMTLPDPDGTGPLPRPFYEWSYDLAGRLLNGRNPAGDLTTSIWNDRDELVSVTEPDPDGTGSLPAPRTTWTYNARGNIRTQQDTTGNTAYFDFDATDQLTSVTDPIAAGFGLSASTPRTSYTYDGLGFVTSTTDVLGQMTTYAYDLAGNLISVTDPMSNTSTYEYDPLGRLIVQVSTDPDGADGLLPVLQQSWEYTDTSFGHRITATDSAGNTTVQEYGPTGWLLSETLPDPDGAGPLAVTHTTYRYDPAGNVTQIIESSGGLSRTTVFGYDSRGRMTFVTSAIPGAGNPVLPALTTGYGYDALGRQTLRQNTDGTAVRYRYDAEMNLVAEAQYTSSAATAAARETRYTHDKLGRVTMITAPDGTVTHTSYDPLGNIAGTSAPDPDGPTGFLPAPATSYIYDPTGRYLTETVDHAGRKTKYEYDRLGQLLSVSEPDPASINGSNRPTSTFSYNAVGDITEFLDPNGNRITYEYDALRRLLSVGQPMPDEAEPDSPFFGLPPVAGNDYGLSQDNTGDPYDSYESYMAPPSADDEFGVFDLPVLSPPSVDSVPGWTGLRISNLHLEQDTGIPGDNRTSIPILVAGIICSCGPYERTVSATATANGGGQGGLGITVDSSGGTWYRFELDDQLSATIVEVEIQVSMFSFDLVTNLEYSDYTSVTFTFLYDPADSEQFEIAEFALVNDTGVAGDMVTTDASFVGHVTGFFPDSYPGSYPKLMIDFQGNGIFDRTAYIDPATGGFSFDLTDQLAYGPATVRVWAKDFQSSRQTPYVSLSFDFVDGTISNHDPDCNWQSDGSTEVTYGSTDFNVVISLLDDTDIPDDKITGVPVLHITGSTEFWSTLNIALQIDADGDWFADEYVFLYGGIGYSGTDAMSVRTDYVNLAPYLEFGLANLNIWGHVYADRGDEYYYRDDNLGSRSFEFMYLDQSCSATQYSNGGRAREYFTYDPDGRLATWTDVIGRTTAYGYDDRGREITTQTANGITSTSYDPLGRIASTRQPDPTTLNGSGGPLTSFRYDLLDRVTAITNPVGGVQRFEYNSKGQLWKQIDEANHTTTFAYDTLGRLFSSTDGAGNTTTRAYDAMDRVTSTTDPLLHQTVYSYDNLGRLVEQTDPENGTVGYTYDFVGNLHVLTDPVGNATVFQYDLLDRLTQEQILDDDGSNLSRVYQYDPVGNLVRQTDRNGRVREFDWSFIYDGSPNYRFDNERWLHPNGTTARSITARYDEEFGLLMTSIADPAARYEYTYDALGRVDEVNSIVPVNPNAAWGGTADAISVRLDYQYDNLDRRTLVAASQSRASFTTGDPVGGSTTDFRTTWKYDAMSRVTRIEQAAHGNVASVTEKRVDISYTADSQFNTINRYADLAAQHHIATTSFSYHTATGWLSQISHTSPGDMSDSFPLNYFWAYDAAGRITNAVSPDGTATYSYDDTSQLTSVDHSATSDETYGYDSNGNRNTTGYVTAANNRPVSDGTFNYDYDAEGNRIRRTNMATGGYTSYNWDYRNRLTSIRIHDQYGSLMKIVDYTYDAFDRRVSRTVDEYGMVTTQEYFYDDRPGSSLDDIVLVFDGFDLAQRHLHGPAIDQFFASEDTWGDVIWGLTDNQGTVRDVVHHNGSSVTSVDHIRYDAFGNITSGSPDDGAPYAFTGREWDADAGLYYYRARWYDPLIGRFVNEDPISFAAGDANVQRYVGNDPVNSTDPSGLARRPGSIGRPISDADGKFVGTLYDAFGLFTGNRPVSRSMRQSDGSIIRYFVDEGLVALAVVDETSHNRDAWDDFFRRNGNQTHPQQLTDVLGDLSTANIDHLPNKITSLGDFAAAGSTESVRCSATLAGPMFVRLLQQLGKGVATELGLNVVGGRAVAYSLERVGDGVKIIVRFTKGKRKREVVIKSLDELKDQITGIIKRNGDEADEAARLSKALDDLSAPGSAATRNFFGHGETVTPPVVSGKLSRGSLDVGNVKHYVWEGPGGKQFDLMLDAQTQGNRLIINEAHIMPHSGSFDAARGTLGRSGLRQLSNDLGRQFGVEAIDIPGRIGRTTGRTGGFGPITIPVK